LGRLTDTVRLVGLLMTLCVVGVTATAPAGEDVKDGSLFVWSLSFRGDIDQARLSEFADLLSGTLEQVSGDRAIRRDGMEPPVECSYSDLDCMISVAAGAGAHTLVYGDLARIGDSWLVSLFAVGVSPDVSGSRATSRVFSSFDDIRGGMGSMVVDLVGQPVPDASAPGPVTLDSNIAPTTQAPAVTESRTPAIQASGVPGSIPRVDPVSLTRHRVTISPTAVGIGKGNFTVTGYGLGIWELQYGVTENVQVGALTLLPVGLAGLVPLVSANYRVNDNFAIGGGVYAGMIGTFTDLSIIDEALTVIYGGSFQMTGIWGRHSLNVSLIAGSAAGRLMYDLGNEEGEVDRFANLPGAYMLPSIGYRFEMNPFWSLQIEVAIPVYAGRDGPMDIDSVVTMIFYGVRGHGGMVYGDIGFMIPAHLDYFTGIWRYMPFGIPYFSLGFAF